MRVEQDLRFDTLAKVAAGSGAQGVDDELERREHDDLDVAKVVGRGDVPGGLDAVDLGHPDIHQDNVSPFAAGQRDRVAPVGCLARNVHVGDGVDEQPEGGAQQRLVVGKQDTDRHDVTGLSLWWGSRIAVAGSARPVAAASSTGSVAVTR
jgi:hypothetical protein